MTAQHHHDPPRPTNEQPLSVLRPRTLRAARFVRLLLGVKIVVDAGLRPRATVYGVWARRCTIVVRPGATAYDVLHEAGHVLCGLMCCREHCEYAAHGAALALAKHAGIRLRPDELGRIDYYAGYSPRAACGAFARPGTGRRAREAPNRARRAPAPRGKRRRAGR